MVSRCHLEVRVVIADQKLGIVVDDSEVEEKLAPGMVAFAGDHQDDGNIVSEVVHAPQKHPVILMPCHVEILPIKGKGRRELTAEGEGELIVAGELCELLLTDPPGSHGREIIFPSEVSERETIEVVREHGFGITPMGVDGEVSETRFAEETKRFASFRLSNNCFG